MMKFFCLCMFILIGYFAQAQKSVNKKRWIKIEDSTFCMLYPSTFTLNRTGWMGTTFILFDEQSCSAFKPNIQLIIKNLPTMDSNDFGHYMDIARQQIKQIQNSHIFLDTVLLCHGTTIHKLIYDGRISKCQLQWQQYMMYTKNLLYVLTFAVERKNFGIYQNLVTQIMNGFYIK